MRTRLRTCRGDKETCEVPHRENGRGKSRPQEVLWSRAERHHSDDEAIGGAVLA